MQLFIFAIFMEKKEIPKTELKIHPQKWHRSKEISDAQMEASAESFQFCEPTSVAEVEQLQKDVLAEPNKKFLTISNLFGHHFCHFALCRVDRSLRIRRRIFPPQQIDYIFRINMLNGRAKIRK